MKPLRDLRRRSDKDFIIPISPNFAILGEDQMNIDEATEVIFKEKGWPLLGGPSGRGASYWCVTPETRVLTADLQWMRAGKLVLGQKLLAFDEEPGGAGRQSSPDARGKRKLRGAAVLHTGLIKRHVYRLQLSDGTSLRASAEHPWLVIRTEGDGFAWMSVKRIVADLAENRRRFIPRFMRTWETCWGRDAGYLAGIFDGEGQLCFSNKKTGTASRGCFRIGVGQNPGIVLRKIHEMLTRFEFTFGTCPSKQNRVIRTHLTGGVLAAFRLLGAFRPYRLLEKFTDRVAMDGHLGELPKNIEKLEIIGVVDEGVQRVVALETSTKTYFAEGFGAHNSTAQRCPRLFQASYDGMRVDEQLRQEVNKVVPLPLQIGALFHTLQALYYAAELGENCVVAADRGGLCRVENAGRGRRSLWVAPADAADQFIAALKKMCGVGDLEAQLKASIGAGELPKPEGRAPILDVVLEAERLFDAHCNHWGRIEDVTPLAIEWLALDERLGYSCRYDLIGRVGENDPAIPPGIYIFEKKTAGWIDEKFLEGWRMDLEILGEIHCWNRSGCDVRFGPLAGVVMDCVSKGKVPECRRLLIPPTIPQVIDHARWIRYTQAQIAIWRATETYPQNFSACHGRYGRCGNWDVCTLGVKA